MTIGLPLREPRLTQGFGVNPAAYAKFGLKGHNGLDYGCPTGTTVLACDDGTISFIGDDPTGYGHYVKIVHSWGESLYAHLQNHLVTLGFPVKRGQAIALSGNTGNSTGPHLHFGIRINPYNKQDGWSGYSDPALYFGPVSPPTPPQEEFPMREQYKLVFSILHSKPVPTEADIDQAIGSALPPYEYGVQDLNNRVIPVSVEPYQLEILKLQTQLKEANDEIARLNALLATTPPSSTGGEDNNPGVPTLPNDPSGGDSVRARLRKILDWLKKNL